ncbi:MAG: SnoaL-like domain-containing protein [Gemmatimonadaceae bacterium]
MQKVTTSKATTNKATTGKSTTTKSTTTTSKSTATVAEKLVELCRSGRNADAINTLYADDIVSVEPVGSPSMPAEMKGIDAIRGKNQWWSKNNEVHSAEVEGPFVADDKFAVRYGYETTNKPTGKRGRMDEVALYTVKNGKIVREQFFYNATDA